MKNTTILFEASQIRKLRTYFNLHKVGVHYFAKCCFCNDPGDHFCIKEGATEYVCFNCPRHGSTDSLLKELGDTTKPTATQISIC